MMWTTCFAREAPRRGDRVDDRDRPLERDRDRRFPTSSEQLAAQRVDERLAGVHAAAGQQPVLLPRLLVPAEEDRGRSSGAAQTPGCAARRPSPRPDEPKPLSPRSLAGSSSTSRSSACGHGDDDAAARSASPARPRTAPAGRCCAGSRAARRGSRSRRGPGVLTIVIPCSRGEARARRDQPGVALRDRDGDARADQRSLARGELVRARRRRGRGRRRPDTPASGSTGVVAEPCDRDLDHARRRRAKRPRSARTSRSGSRARIRTPSSRSVRDSIGGPSA